MVVATNTINATLYDKLNFNFTRDIVPIASIGRTPFVMVVNPSVPAKTVPEFIAYAKTNPGKLNMASSGIGSASHVFGELFKAMAGVDLVHVPYRGSSYPDLLAGQVQLTFNSLAGAAGYIRANQLRALAVTSATRSQTMPDIPTVGEFVPGYEAGGWEGIGAPKSTPAEIIDKLNKKINAALADPKMKANLANLGTVATPMSPPTLENLSLRKLRNGARSSARQTSSQSNPRGPQFHKSLPRMRSDVRYGSKAGIQTMNCMSALPPKAEIRRQGCDVRYVP